MCYVLCVMSYVLSMITLKAQTRDQKDKPRQIRNNNFIPAVLYGHNVKNESLKIKKIDFNQVYATVGESNLIDLVVDNNSAIKILIKDTQRGLLKNDFIHADFYKVNMQQKITAEIPLNFIGESRAVKEQHGVLMKNIDKIEVECLPGDLIHQIDIDLSLLNSIHDAIRLNDLKLSDNITLVNKTNDVIASVAQQRIQEEEKKQEETVEATTEDKEGEKKTKTKTEKPDEKKTEKKT